MCKQDGKKMSRGDVDGLVDGAIQKVNVALRRATSLDEFYSLIIGCEGFENRAVQWVVAIVLKDIAAASNQELMALKGKNHEVWEVCSTCGGIYDARTGVCC